MTMMAQKAPASELVTPRMRRRAGIHHIHSTLMHLVQLELNLTSVLEKNPMADTAMLVTSLLNPVHTALETILGDCRQRGYPEVQEIYRDVRNSVHETHRCRSDNAKKHQEKKKRERAEFEAVAAAAATMPPAKHHRPLVSMKAPRSALAQTRHFEEPLI
jgi:hypothetical protein